MPGGQHSRSISLGAWREPGPVVLSARGRGLHHTEREGRMSLVIAIMAAPFLAATGIYNPPVLDRHHRCIAEPGSFEAIYCSSAEAPPGKKKHRAAR